MVKFNITMKKLLEEYMKFDTNCGLRFGQYITGKYTHTNGEPDFVIYYEKNNGVAYKMILNRIFQQDLKSSS